MTYLALRIEPSSFRTSRNTIALLCQNKQLISVPRVVEEARHLLSIAFSLGARLKRCLESVVLVRARGRVVERTISTSPAFFVRMLLEWIPEYRIHVNHYGLVVYMETPSYVRRHLPDQAVAVLSPAFISSGVSGARAHLPSRAGGTAAGRVLVLVVSSTT